MGIADNTPELSEFRSVFLNTRLNQDLEDIGLTDAVVGYHYKNALDQTSKDYYGIKYTNAVYLLAAHYIAILASPNKNNVLFSGHIGSQSAGNVSESYQHMGSGLDATRFGQELLRLRDELPPNIFVTSASFQSRFT